MPTYLTQAEAARKLGVSRSLMSLWVRDKRIKVTRTAGGTPLIALRDCKRPKPKKMGRPKKGT